MKNTWLVLLFCLLYSAAFSQTQKVSVVENDQGLKLVVDGEDFMINGMNWDYFPIGTNFSYSLWKQPDDIIVAALDVEMSLLKNMGVNVIRLYTGIQPKWIKYIYEKYGIYTMLNHSFGRYGLTINGSWVAITDYRDEATKELLLSEVETLAETYKNTPGLLLFLLGNENNYGLFWAGAETEDFPDEEDQKREVGEKRGRPMYKLMNDAAMLMKGIDSNHPVAICNGDVLFLDIIAEECPDVDILGINSYRGVTFTDLFDVVKEKYNKPILFSEFGSDAFNAKSNKEDQRMQAYYMVGNWKDIYENAAGMGRAENCIGGFTFQFSDGWWKFGQTKNLDVHDTNASWANGGYDIDYVEGENNMNEEWFGICAKGPTDERGLYQLFPRAAYYALQEVHQFNVYADGATPATLEKHFGGIELMRNVLQARGDKASLTGEKARLINVSELRADITTFSTGGSLISTPEVADPTTGLEFPDELGFDHMQSFFIGFEANPTESVSANINFNVLGNVAENPIDEIFYENRGRPLAVNTDEGNVILSSRERVKIYAADFTWKSKYLDLTGFYRTSHYHWGYEGDFFGLYPEANYGPNIDIYNGNAPFGFEIEGKKFLEHFKVAFGPELWWGANPAVLVKYGRNIAGFDVTGIYHEDLDEQAPAVSSFAVPAPPTRRATLHIKRKSGGFGFEMGGIWAGQPRIDELFQIVDGDPGSYEVYQDRITMNDTWGGKVKVTIETGPFKWYAQGAAMGLVAGGGVDNTKTFTGWRLKDSGSGNQWNILSGFQVMVGDFQFAPNFLWQKPIIGPIPIDVPAPGRPRNILDDPFAVRSNRETVAGEILITYDPTPGTWMYEWNSDVIEDAPFAISTGFVYRHHPTTMDAAIGILGDGRTIFAFPGAPPAKDLWEAHARIVSKLSPELGLIANLFAGDAQANGSDPRLIHRYGGDLRLIYKQTKLISMAKINDWGPFDYHRDFNLTFPLQLMADLSTTVGKASWWDLPASRLGIRYTWRSMNEYSPRYCPAQTLGIDGIPVCDPEAPGHPFGQEWEFRTYFQINISK